MLSSCHFLAIFTIQRAVVIDVVDAAHANPRPEKPKQSTRTATPWISIAPYPERSTNRPDFLRQFPKNSAFSIDRGRITQVARHSANKQGTRTRWIRPEHLKSDRRRTHGLARVRISKLPFALRKCISTSPCPLTHQPADRGANGMQVPQPRALTRFAETIGTVASGMPDHNTLLLGISRLLKEPMADVPDSKSGPRKRVWVQVPPSVLG